MKVIEFCAMAGIQSEKQQQSTRARTRDQAADLKDKNADQEDSLEVNVFVSLAPNRLRRCDGQKEGRPKPANVVERVELIGYFGNRRRHDVHVERREKGRERQSNNDRPQPPSPGIFFLWCLGRSWGVLEDRVFAVAARQEARRGDVGGRAELVAAHIVLFALLRRSRQGRVAACWQTSIPIVTRGRGM